MKSKTAEEYLKKEQIDNIDLIIGNVVLLSYPPQIPSKKLSILLEEYASIKLAEKDKEIEKLKKSLEGLLDGIDTFCKTIPAQMTSEAIYLWEKRTEAHESLNK